MEGSADNGAVWTRKSRPILGSGRQDSAGEEGRSDIDLGGPREGMDRPGPR